MIHKVTLIELLMVIINFTFILKKEVRLYNFNLLYWLAYPYYPNNESNFDDPDIDWLDRFLKKTGRLFLSNDLTVDNLVY